MPPRHPLTEGVAAEYFAPLVADFTLAIAQAAERFAVERLERALRESLSLPTMPEQDKSDDSPAIVEETAPALQLPAATAPRKARAKARKRAQQTCYYPDCSNVAAPLYGMFCAAEHKDLSKGTKERIRKQRLASR
jgi:hypothetical protein